MIQATELKRSAVLELDEAPWLVLEVTTQTPSARGASTLIKAKLRNLKTSQVLTKSFRGADMLALADVDRREVQYLYRDGDGYAFMDSETFDQYSLDAETLGDVVGYLLDGMQLRALTYNEQVLTIELPQVVELTIADTGPVIKNATATSQSKPATLETGIVIQVPEYMTSGEKVRVDTRDGRCLGRAKG
ncbi:MAG: elongation factor P [Pseudomonadota bacterium]